MGGTPKTQSTVYNVNNLYVSGDLTRISGKTFLHNKCESKYYSIVTFKGGKILVVNIDKVKFRGEGRFGASIFRVKLEKKRRGKTGEKRRRKRGKRVLKPVKAIKMIRNILSAKHRFRRQKKYCAKLLSESSKRSQGLKRKLAKVNCRRDERLGRLFTSSKLLSSKLAGSQESRKEANRRQKASNGNRGRNNMKILLWNKGNAEFRYKFDVIKDMIEESAPQVFVINELNIDQNDDIELYNIEGYEFLVDNLQNKRTGMYVAQYMSYKRLKDDISDNSEINIQIGFPRKKQIIISSFYRQWKLDKTSKTQSGSHKHQLDRLEAQIKSWEKIIDMNRETYIVGDINIDTRAWSLIESQKSSYQKSQNALSNLVKDRILNRGFFKLNNLPTRNSTAAENGCLDIILTNSPEKISSVITKVNYKSDHAQLEINRPTKIVEEEPYYVWKRTFKDTNYDEVKAAIFNNPKYSQVFEAENSNEVATMIMDILNEALDVYAPWIRVQINNKTKYKERYSNETLDAIIIKALKYEEVVADPSAENIRDYKAANNECHRLKKKDRNNNAREMINNAKNEKETWQKTKEILNYKRAPPPNILIDNNEVIRGGKNIAQKMNRKYLQNIRELVEKIPPKKANPMDNFKRCIPKPENILNFEKTNDAKVSRLINSMKPTKSNSVSNLNMVTVKKLKDVLVPLITTLINKIQETEEFPDILKYSKVVPIKKPNKLKTDPLGYRPVNILEPLSKLIEKHWQIMLKKFLEENNLILYQHNGGIKGRSTATANINILGQMADILSNREVGALTQLDLSKAFEIVKHEILLEKLKWIGLSENAINQLKSFMSNRRQLVEVSGARSDPMTLGERSTIQGSILAQTLYQIFTLDQPQLHHPTIHLNQTEYNKCKNPNNTTFVDDINSIIRSKMGENIWQTVKKSLQETNDYFTNNEIVNNIDKTKIMIISPNQEDTKGSIELDGETVKHSPELRILGTTVQSNMKWDSHITSGKKALLKTLNMKLSALKQLSRIMSKNQLKKIADGTIISRLTTNIEVWGESTNKNIQKLQNILNQTTKIVLGPKGWGMTPEARLRELKWLPVKELYKKSVAKLTHKILNNKEPQALFESFTNNRNPRKIAENKVAQHNPGFGFHWAQRNTFEFRALNIYNALPHQLTEIKSHHLFTKWLRKWTLNNKTQVPNREHFEKAEAEAVRKRLEKRRIAEESRILTVVNEINARGTTSYHNDGDGNRDGSVTADAAPNADETRDGQRSSDGPRGTTSAMAGNSGRTISGDSRIS